MNVTMCQKRKQNSSSNNARNRLEFLIPKEPRQAEFSHDYSKKPPKIPSGNASPITVNTGTAWDSHPGIGEGLSDSDFREQSRIREVKYRFVHAARPISRRGLREQQTAVG